MKMELAYDVWYIVAEYLPTRDFFSLTYTCKWLNSLKNVAFATHRRTIRGNITNNELLTYNFTTVANLKLSKDVDAQTIRVLLSQMDRLLVLDVAESIHFTEAELNMVPNLISLTIFFKRHLTSKCLKSRHNLKTLIIKGALVDKHEKRPLNCNDFGELTGLTKLDLRVCESQEISLKKLTPGLQVLHLSGFSELTKPFSTVMDITDLHVGELISKIPFHLLPNLKKLDTTASQFNNSITAELFQMFGGVQELIMGQSPKLDYLEALTQYLPADNNLLRLSIFNSMVFVDACFQRLSKLRSLKISFCDFVTNKGLISLPDLEHLQVQFCKNIHVTAELVHQLPKLIYVDVAGNIDHEAIQLLKNRGAVVLVSDSFQETMKKARNLLLKKL